MLVQAFQGLLVECDSFGNAITEPCVDDPDLVGNELDTIEPHLEIGVSAKGVDLVLGALNQEETADLDALRFEDDTVEMLDASLLLKAGQKVLPQRRPRCYGATKYVVLPTRARTCDVPMSTSSYSR